MVRQMTYRENMLVSIVLLYVVYACVLEAVKAHHELHKQTRAIYFLLLNDHEAHWRLIHKYTNVGFVRLNHRCRPGTFGIRGDHGHRWKRVTKILTNEFCVYPIDVPRTKKCNKQRELLRNC